MELTLPVRWECEQRCELRARLCELEQRLDELERELLGSNYFKKKKLYPLRTRVLRHRDVSDPSEPRRLVHKYSQ